MATTSLNRHAGEAYTRGRPLVLVNGLLIDQAECWYYNERFWRSRFDVHMPNLLVYEGLALHQRASAGLPIDIDYLVEQLRLYLDTFAQSPPYHLVATSLGAKVAVEYAARYPAQVARMVLLCPSGLGQGERLPVMEGVGPTDIHDIRAILLTLFHDPRHADPRIADFYEHRFINRRWRSGLVRTIRGTMAHSVRDRLDQVAAPTLLVSGQEDRIVDPKDAETAAGLLMQGRVVSVAQCGHAVQAESPWLINRLVHYFLARETLPEQSRLERLLLRKPRAQPQDHHFHPAAVK